MVLSRRILTPISSNVMNPLASVFKEADEIMRRDPTFYYHRWPTLKRYFTTMVLDLESHGSAVNGAIEKAPNSDIAGALEEIKCLVNNCYYFSSQYWRAFSYWLRKGGAFNPRWPLFGEEEASMTVSLLTKQHLNRLISRSKEVWPDYFRDPEKMSPIFKKIQARIIRLCYQRLRYLSQYDPALYSMEDLQQEVCLQMVHRLRSNDYFDDRPSELIGWSMRCVDNIIHNLRGFANADKRAKIIRTKVGDKNEGTQDQFLLRECALNTPLREGEDDSVPFTLADSIRLLGDGAFKEAENTVNTTAFNQLMVKADPKTQKYLKIMWGGEHDPKFWAWFSMNEPKLALREEYTLENPEAIGPWVQRWLKLPTWQLVSFLRTNLPGLLEDRESFRARRSKHYIATKTSTKQFKPGAAKLVGTRK